MFSCPAFGSSKAVCLFVSRRYLANARAPSDRCHYRVSSAPSPLPPSLISSTFTRKSVTDLISSPLHCTFRNCLVISLSKFNLLQLYPYRECSDSKKWREKPVNVYARWAMLMLFYCSVNEPVAPYAICIRIQTVDVQIGGCCSNNRWRCRI